jgi:hypothetical protein
MAVDTGVERVPDEAQTLASATFWSRVRARLPRQRPSLVWWHELLLIGLGYFIYTEIRNGVPSHEIAAGHHAQNVIHFERTLRIFHELGINLWVAAHESVAQVMNYYYATLHFIVTIAVGVWIYRSHQQYARALRTTWYLTNVLALFGYAFYPLAPPRLAAGPVDSDWFFDTVVNFHTWGSWGSGDVASASNQYAAMPSMHIGWSVWCGICIVLLAKRRWVKALGVLYPVATLTVIVGTANHYFLDAAGGLVALGLAFCLSRVLNGRWAFQPDPRVTETRESRRAKAQAAVTA